MKTDNIFWIQLDANRIIKRAAISMIQHDKIDKRYEVKIDGVMHYFDIEDGRKILSALGVKP